MRKPLPLLLCAMFACFSCNLFEDDEKAAARKILNNPPFEKLTDSISDYPKNAALYVSRGRLLSQKNHSHLAVHDFEKAWQLDPSEASGLLYTGSLFMTGDETRAMQVLQDCIRRFPDNTEFARRLSEAYVQTGRPQKALDQYNAILARDPQHFEAWFEKGLILASMKDTAGAIQALENAYNLQPLQLFGLSLAQLYAEKKDPRVIALCDELLARDPEQQATDPLFLKGVYYANTNQRALALEQFEQCIKRNWKFTEAYIEKGIILFERQQVDEALKTFTLAADVSNTYPDIYFWLGRCYEVKGRKQEALNNYYRALALDRNFTEARDRAKRLES